ncbi:MAG: succinylglutamate desuccinylase/aspartoacylase family protein [Alphaproteobacteria bacterium]|nr:succinylglutamate desuccinylase/aspartoacylase family protein [Alphaproteobacteria bacterium]
MIATDFRREFRSAQPGQRIRGRIPLGTSASGSELGIPWILLKGARPGPCLWINGQVHGDEINGLLAGFDFINGIDPARLHGAVVMTTTANPFAMEARRKKTPTDEEDLDQACPGRADGFMTQRLAAALFPIVAEHADVTVCMHAVGTPYEAVPYAVYKLHPASGVEERTLLRLTAHFRPAISCRMSVAAGGTELPGNIAGALDYQLLALGRTAFMLEIGTGGRAEAPHIAQTAAGLRSLAAEMGLLADEAPLPRPARLLRGTKRGHVTVAHGGFARMGARPGHVAHAGTPLLRIENAWGELVETITQPSDVFVISLRRDPVVQSGDRGAYVAWEWDEMTLD